MASSELVSVICRPHPFTSEKIIRSVPYGRRITEILDETLELGSEHLEARVFVDDRLVEKAYWTRVKPKAGHLVTVRVVPRMSGGGGNTGKDVLRIVAMVGVMALAIGVAVLLPPLLPAALAGIAPTLGTLAGFGVMFGGSLRLNAIIARTPQLEGR